MDRNAKESSALQERATDFVDFCGLWTRLAGFRFYTTGSYALDVMAWPDVDINVLYKDAQRSDVYALGSDIIRSLTPHWFELRDTAQEEMSPGHFFLGFEKSFRELLWNVDIWFLSQCEYDQSNAWLKETAARIGKPEKAAIVAIKQHLIDKGDYPGRLSSMAIYEAVLRHDISEPAEFVSWFAETDAATGSDT